ncbi:MAG: zinc-ribbon domain-containing protein [Thermodesulfobacteriota bacterium]|nr:zinc-ribbon domain-containing protein [Thermodesulfobacteriota bacterium]
MDISCEKCGTSFKVADEKLPPGKTVSMRCPKCKGKISIAVPGGQNGAGAKKNAGAGEGAFGFEEMLPDESNYDASEKPFDFIEEEGKTALICEPSHETREEIKKVLDFMEYHISDADDTRDALKKLRYHTYDLIIINEMFGSRSPDANGLLIYLERLKMKIRREIYIVLLTSRFTTMDNMTAFRKSVNLVVNINDINFFEKILNRGLNDYEQFYHIFKDSLRHMDTI